ncbi:alpha/beta hydrolase [Sphingomicrobium sediminis]|uniref:Alpha/beta hydrolase-fold protein n=1 Tax=Sphingomicrobium sediminis TaxID=2950949 RepID=A0A9X2EHV8_9SPHN|nr:alpha/beta hydrolase-fold protein [Sphingomicrobium sediminis]MCM8557857.1 alpha/beta hydrolase-fold protein [Sphingomicrobium sediminis]
MLSIALSLAAATLPPPPANVSAGQVTYMVMDEAEALGIDKVWVWLPDGYATREEGERFPVLYMHDGQNLFDPTLTNYNKEWGMDEAITRLAARGDLREWIVIGIESPAQRWQALFPEKLEGSISDETFVRLGNLADVSEVRRQDLMGDEYLAFLTGTLKPYVDRNYATLAGPEDTAVMGSSMGGLMSIYAIAEHPDIFGQAAGLSVHLPLGLPSEDEAVVADNIRDTMAAWRAYLEASDFDPATNRLYVDHGTGTLDRFYPPYFDAFDAMVAELGWALPNYESRRYTGTEHDEDAWRERVDIPLGFLDRKDP